jgi:hypothetical protein
MGVTTEILEKSGAAKIRISEKTLISSGKLHLMAKALAEITSVNESLILRNYRRKFLITTKLVVYLSLLTILLFTLRYLMERNFLDFFNFFFS